MFGLACLISFGILVFLGNSRSVTNVEQDETRVLESKIRELERDLNRNNAIVLKIGESVADLLKESVESETKIIENVTDRLSTGNQSPDIQMLDLYRKLEFDNPDGGVWKQGWDVHFDPTKFSFKNKLLVFVVPHSHNDPGWVRTFEKYYEGQTRHIINNMVTKVAESPRWKFIWAEISYLDLWWKESEPLLRNKLKELITSGQIEVVTGGWVMNDEANTHYFAMIEQLTSGHEWLRQKIGVSPKNGWAIDPFGMSSSMAYLLKKSGLENMVIQRVHYAIKKALASSQNLEFHWRQNWDREGLTDMMCHLMPFYSYDVPHTCGPDPKICCQFDFRRLSSPNQSPIYCPWRIAPVAINDVNVEKKASLLLDQYRKKSSLYKTNVLLVQLGDDFRYDTQTEFDQQFTNYQKLFDYMNGRDDWFVEAKFGTLQDYFKALHSSAASTNPFPSLSGDFFTYADIDDHYWSGYYTTRPFHKHMDRVLESYMRSADIIFSLTYSHSHRFGNSRHPTWMNEMISMLTAARHNLALFQHHDGITGTSKDFVVVDYAKKLLSSVQSCRRVIEQCVHYLLHPNQGNFAPQIEAQHFLVDDVQLNYDEVAKKTVIQIDGESSRIVFYNSLTSDRIEEATLRISHPNVQVTKQSGEVIQVQLLPVFTNAHEISNFEFDISFIVSIPPLGLATYFIRKFDGPVNANTGLAVSRIIVQDSEEGKIPNAVDPFLIEMQKSFKTFSIKNLHISAEFNANGLLTSITSLSDRKRVEIGVELVSYGSRRGQTMSGAYLFLPDGEARVLLPDDDHYIHVVEGPIRSLVEVHMPFVDHQVVLHSSPGVDGVGLDINNLVKVTSPSNLELAMRFVSNVASERAFYTDLNGLQMTRRERWDKLPLQAHFYPMPTVAYIEDSSTRITVATKQPLGVASLKSGQLEVMLDRRLHQDDNRGLGEGVNDNVIPTLTSFRLLVESKNLCNQDNDQRADGYLSLAGHHALHGLIYPAHQLVWNGNVDDEKMNTDLQPALSSVGEDIHLVNLRTEAKLLDDTDTADPVQVQTGAGIALIVHRLGFNPCFPSNGSTSNGEFSVDALFPDYFAGRVKTTSLTLLHDGQSITKSQTNNLKPMEIYTFNLQP